MTTLIICLFIAALLPYIARVPVGLAMKKLGKYDNNNPRAQQEQLEGFGARALAAHQNAFESLIIFAPAVLLAIATEHTGMLIQQLAIVHILTRVLFNIAYLKDLGTIRSLLWAVATICSFTIIYLCI